MPSCQRTRLNLSKRQSSFTKRFNFSHPSKNAVMCSKSGVHPTPTVIYIPTHILNTGGPLGKAPGVHPSYHSPPPRLIQTHFYFKPNVILAMVGMPFVAATQVTVIIPTAAAANLLAHKGRVGQLCIYICRIFPLSGREQLTHMAFVHGIDQPRIRVQGATTSSTAFAFTTSFHALFAPPRRGCLHQPRLHRPRSAP